MIHWWNKREQSEPLTEPPSEISNYNRFFRILIDSSQLIGTFICLTSHHWFTSLGGAVLMKHTLNNIFVKLKINLVENGNMFFTSQHLSSLTDWWIFNSFLLV